MHAQKHARGLSFALFSAGILGSSLLQLGCTPVGPSMLKGFKLSSSYATASTADTSGAPHTDRMVSTQQWNWPVGDARWDTFAGVELQRETVEQLLKTGKTRVEWSEVSANGTRAPRASQKIRVALGVNAKDSAETAPQLTLELLDAQLIDGQTRSQWEIRIVGFPERKQWSAEKISVLAETPISQLRPI